MIGREVGTYRIIEKIGEGGMGIVFKGIHTKLEQEVAIKELSPALSRDPAMRERFINEARIQARLIHANVVNILNYIEEGENVFLVMEFVRGETLEKRLLDRGEALPVQEALVTFMQVLDALGFMHSKGIIHRDMKPSNIMVTDDGKVKVTDFGIAKVMGEKGYTKTGTKVGTMWYMSPEVIRGEEATALSDIYSLGISLFQMVTGRVPFTGDSEYMIMKGHLEEKPPSPWEINSQVSREIGKVILRAISKDPKDRFQSAADFGAALRAVIESPVNSGSATKPIGVSSLKTLTRPTKIPSISLRMPLFALKEWDRKKLIFALAGIGIVVLILLYLTLSGGKKPEEGKMPITAVPHTPSAGKEERGAASLEVTNGTAEAPPQGKKAKQRKDNWSIRK